MSTPLRRRWFQFSLSGLLKFVLVVACFAGAIGMIVDAMNQHASTNTITWSKGQAQAIALFLYAPAIGALVGLGCGTILRRPIVGLIVGLAVPLFIDAVILYCETHPG